MSKCEGVIGTAIGNKNDIAANVRRERGACTFDGKKTAGEENFFIACRNENGNVPGIARNIDRHGMQVTAISKDRVESRPCVEQT